MGASEADALLGGGAAPPVPGWNPSTRRPWRDTYWLYWWLANFAVALAWGASLATEVPAGDPATHLQQFSTCNGAAAGRRRLLGASDPAKQLGYTAAVLAVGSAVAAVGVGVGSVFLLRDEGFTKVCVYGAIAAQVRLPGPGARAKPPSALRARTLRAPSHGLTRSAGAQIGIATVLGLLCLFSGQLLGAFLFLLYASVFSCIVWCYESQLKLCCKLLSMSAHALADNLRLLPVTLASFFAGGLLIFVPVGALVVTASRVGSAYPAPGAVQSTSTPGTCMAPVETVFGMAPSPAPSNAAAASSAAGAMMAAPCCAFSVAPAAVAYIVFAFFFLMWSLFILFEIRSFVVAHVTARWYYHPRGVALPGAPMQDALKLAVGPSSGSLCFGGAVLSVAELLRMIADAVQNQEGNILQIIMEAIVACILNLVAEFLSAMTRFATIRVAITGDSFWEGACAATDLFKRNLMNAVAVWSFPPMVLHLLCFTCAVIFGGVAALIFSVDVHAVGATGTVGSLGLGLGIALFIGIALLFWLVLSYVACILLNVVDTMYYCYALDVDKHLVTRRDVHELYEIVPGVKVVANPDNSMGLAGQYA